MNCKEFESTLRDTAREALTDANRRASAEAHGADCEPCAALLSDARSLTAGLRALSSQTASASAPPRVEANLLAAFRAQRAASAPAAPAAGRECAPVVVPFAAKRWSWSRTFGAAGLAAAAAVALVVLVPQMFKGPRSNRATYQADSRQPSRAKVEQPPPARIIVPPGALPVEGAQDDSIEKELTPPAAVRPSRVNRAAAMTSVKYNGGARNNGARAVAASPVSAGERAEITTEFIPLAQGGGFVAGEGGHVVRVELPRTALARFGLPVNAEASDGRVKADVLIGEDGMARAIRFVR